MTATRPPLVSLVIPVHQAGNDLNKALDSIRRSRWQPEAVILIDNGSTDGAIEAALGEYSGLTVIRNSSNLGFGAACNQGLELARQQGHAFTLLLNQDAQLATDTLGSMLDLANRHPRAAVVGCLTLSSDSACSSHHDDPTVLYNGSWRRWLPTWQRLPDIGARGRTAIREPQQVDYVWGHGMLLRLDALSEVPFDPGFFMYYEDLDLCWRLQEAGWEIWCDSRVLLWHHQSDPARAGRSRFQRWRMKASSSRYFYRKRHGRLAADGLWLLHHLRESAPLLLEGHWPAVLHIWLATLSEWLWPRCPSVTLAVPAPLEHGLQTTGAERAPSS